MTSLPVGWWKLQCCLWLAERPAAAILRARLPDVILNPTGTHVERIRIAVAKLSRGPKRTADSFYMGLWGQVRSASPPWFGSPPRHSRLMICMRSAESGAPGWCLVQWGVATAVSHRDHKWPYECAATFRAAYVSISHQSCAQGPEYLSVI
ncbi:hypothetical protein C8Q74DRAFT_429621 [Fomes fomentarius]|nr:hypothetical protein C8Q74DRAFT_429621 [Fomes fomentarius]